MKIDHNFVDVTYLEFVLHYSKAQCDVTEVLHTRHILLPEVSTGGAVLH